MIDIKFNPVENSYLVSSNEIFYQGFTNDMIKIYKNDVLLDIDKYFLKILSNKSFEVVLENATETSVFIELIFKGNIRHSATCNSEITDEIFDEVLENFSIEQISEEPIVPVYDVRFKNPRTKNSLLFISENKCEIDFDIEFYKPEIYPEFPSEESLENSIELDSDSFVLPLPRNRVVKVYHKLKEEVDYKVSVFKTNPLVHFSTVESLKNSIKNLGFAITNAFYDDEKLKELITEKSKYVFEQFGLTEKIISSDMLLPILKNLSEYHCMKKLVAIGFITKEIEVSNDGGATETFSNSSKIKLGKFEVNASGSSGSGTGSGGANISAIDSYSIIKNLISEEEEVLSMAIHKYNVAGTILKGGIR